MACTSTPTATLFGSSVGSTLSTTSTESISTLSDTFVTDSTTLCLETTTALDNSTGCASTTVITSVETITGGLTTIEVPVQTEVVFTNSFPTQTLFGSSCDSGGGTTGGGGGGGGGSGITTGGGGGGTSGGTGAGGSAGGGGTTIGPTTTPKSHITSVPSTITQPPSLVTHRASTTLANGQFTVVTVIVSSSVSPSVVFVPTTAPDVQTANTSGHNSNAKLGAIIGGVAGGVVAMFAIAAVVWFFIRKRKTWDDIFDADHDAIDFRPDRLVRERDQSTRMSIGSEINVEPKPYTYGLVGQTGNPNSPFNSPPGSPTGRTPSHAISDVSQNYGGDFNPYPSSDYPHTIGSDGGPIYSPDLNQTQYLPDVLAAQHHRQISGASLMSDGPILRMQAVSRISPEPSLYSQPSLRPGFSRDSSAASGMPLHQNRPSTSGSSHSRASSDQMIVMPTQVQQAQQRGQRRGSHAMPPSAIPEFGVNPPPSSNGHGYDLSMLGRRTSSRRTSSSGNARPTSPRTLMMTNWNPSTDAISVDPRRGGGNPNLGHVVNTSMSSTATVQAGPSICDVVYHVDGGRLEAGGPASGDTKPIPAHAPPEYTE